MVGLSTFIVGVAIILALLLPYSPTVVSWLRQCWSAGDVVTLLFGPLADSTLFAELFMLGGVLALWTLLWLVLRFLSCLWLML